MPLIKTQLLEIFFYVMDCSRIDRIPDKIVCLFSLGKSEEISTAFDTICANFMDWKILF